MPSIKPQSSHDDDERRPHVSMEKVDAHSPPETCQLITQSGEAKAKLPWIDLIVKSFFGGVFISLGSLVDLVIVGGSPQAREANPALIALVASLTFPIGFVLVILTNVELVTSNMAVFAYTTLQRKTSMYDLLRNWIVSYILNLCGCLFFAGVLTWWSNTLSSPSMSTYAVIQAEQKVNTGWGYNFTRGIGCNWLVGLAVYMATSGKDNFSKIIGIYLPILAFVTLGYQHSVANFFLVPVGMFYGTNFGVGKYIYQCVIPVTLGNIVGGAGMAGVFLWFLYGRDEDLAAKTGQPLSGENKRHVSFELSYNMLGNGNTFDPNADIPDLSGKVFVVTGGSAGIGYGISAHILQHNPQKLYLLGKKQHHLDEAAEGLKKFGDVSRVEFVQVELEDLQQTDQVAKRLASELQRLDALILNAGLGVGPYGETKDGIDSHMQVNVFAQHHLAMTLLPKLIATPDSRLCLQSSDMHRAAPSSIKFADLNEINTDIGPAYLYNRTKLAQIHLVRALVRRKERGELGLMPGKGPWINATHPGGVKTDQQEQAIDAYGTLGKIGVAVVRPFLKDPIDQGCRPILFAATSDAVKEEEIDGCYIVPDRKITDPTSQALDENLGEQLWRLTETVLKERLG
ncbi:oxidoreductase bli- mitochondrial [Fusarium longipes]|uniref:Oxidoreductase bli-mitochondrial n=1 Tax=Fusarium longipes TaxID=694270 RepID=A0A395TA40_9HYPO|nr:oxidoreductase bli- mitochondrial [Fusarium longipes]